jgi:hypothetical protein
MGREDKARTYVTVESDMMAGSGRDRYAYEDISGCPIDEQGASTHQIWTLKSV